MKRLTKKNLTKLLTEYGIHLWVILFLANVLLVYTFRFAINAATPQEPPKSPLLSQETQQTDDTSPQPSEQVSETPESPTPSPSPGPLINLSFSLPGIGSGGGNLKPLHESRDVTVYLYPVDVNSMDPNVKPLYTIPGKVIYDTDFNVGTYTSFINKNLDLGTDVPNGRYQLTYKTTQTLPVLIKNNDSDIRGKVLTLEAGQVGDPLPHQTLIFGDIAPGKGDNQIDISDYNAFVYCFGGKADTKDCPNRAMADFDDNGTIDGIDYNLLIRGFKSLLEQGIAVPTLSIPQPSNQVSRLSYLSTTPKPSKAPSPAVKKTPPQKGNPLGTILLVLFVPILIVGGIIFFLRKKQAEDFIQSVLHHTPPPEGTKDAQTQPTDQPAAPETPEQTPPVPTAESQRLDRSQPEAPAASPQPPETPAEPAVAAPVTTPPPTPATPPAVGEAVAKEYYVKKQTQDDAKTGWWVTLTDDNGPLLGFYKGTDVTEGFATVKGVMKQEKDKTYLEISEITAEG